MRTITPLPKRINNQCVGRFLFEIAQYRPLSSDLVQPYRNLIATPDFDSTDWVKRIYATLSGPFSDRADSIQAKSRRGPNDDLANAYVEIEKAGDQAYGVPYGPDTAFPESAASWLGKGVVSLLRGVPQSLREEFLIDLLGECAK